MTIPTVEEIVDLPDNAARALWLLRAPDGWYYAYLGSICRELELCQFVEGRTYAMARHNVASCVRLDDGSVPHTIMLSLQVAHGDLSVLIRKGARG